VLSFKGQVDDKVTTPSLANRSHIGTTVPKLNSNVSGHAKYVQAGAGREQSNVSFPPWRFDDCCDAHHFFAVNCISIKSYTQPLIKF